MTTLPTTNSPWPKKYILGQSLCTGNCGRLTRSKHAKAGDNPGTVARTGRGMCAGCYVKVLEAERATKQELRFPILKCTSCDAMTRSTADNPDLAPGTRRRVSGGKCTECYKKRSVDADTARVVAARAELDGFLAARGRRAAERARRAGVAA